ncbi:MAG: FtsX-like permease family protein [Bifidobacterium tibiigranuli]|jgi:putative ABC transport system permease protein|uniref:ABC transporter permease n=1 Tax=Bifidobacterium tibiigranuli TaxID=2172043 RepID=UPI0026F140CC|nr:FtsX-like permease family protein [Bifidobacterium tibiigranuli]MCI1674317.1 FtsX-like permease family protein [Bifidobacterium tibiigranuli]MCI1713403.1 FtsX-like permease family protein [Bifidobacterium tibiigranuli]MCI1834113.1 FtsX-like permease family protein [Bifidobacterium tibiigranuli]
MFFLRMILRSFSRQLRRRLLIAVTVCLSATIAVAMLGVVFDVGDKLNAELSSYGSNITVQPKSDAVVSDLYNTEGAQPDPTSFLKESDVPKIKTTFWAFNITDFAPQLNIHAEAMGGGMGAGGAHSDAGVHSGSAGGSGGGAGTTAATVSVPVVGTWFNKTLHLPTGESTVAGVQGLRSWWKVEGSWPKDDKAQAMIGKDLAARLHLGVGDELMLHKATATGAHTMQMLAITGVYDSGDTDNGSVYMPSALAQKLADLPDSIDRIEVKALTTPENDLARKAAKNPAALSQEEWETWYCTAYPSSIAYQIEEVLPGAVAKQVRQVSALQGDVMLKTQAVMMLMTVLSLIAAAVAVANLMAASIGERSAELALLKAVGATDGAVSRLMLAETAAISMVGALAGAGLGSGLAQLVGHVVFGSGITMRPMVFVLVFVLLAVTILIASFSSIRSILNLRPAEVLHGR